MQAYHARYKGDKKTGRGLVFVCLLLLPFVLFSLSAFTCIPNTTQNRETGTTLPQAAQARAPLPASLTDGSCSDDITFEQFSLSEIKIYFNACALEHLTAILASATAAGAVADVMGFVSLVCGECDPLVPWIGAIVSEATAGIDFLQYAAQNCGGAILDLSWDEGIQVKSACSSQDNGS